MIVTQRSPLFILCLLGALSVVSPFAIDLYLAAFTHMADDLKTSSAIISLSLSTYFIGLSFGQFIYGPLLDRFGRKKPIYAGLAIFIASSIGCAITDNVDVLIALRLLQGLGGCVAQIAAVTMVHDFFPVEQSAKIFSLLFLFIGTSPLLAPTLGSILLMMFGWRWIFIFMAVLIGTILTLIFFLLPEGHEPDTSISLQPGPIARTFLSIFKHPTFHRYALAGAFSFAGLFTYVAGSPIIFMEQFHVSAKMFGLIFAGMAAGFIGGSQINVFLLRHFDSATIFRYALHTQVVVGVIFFAAAGTNSLGLMGTLIMLFIFLMITGISNPNAAALALAPFRKNAGSASALLGVLQLGTGALVSTWIGLAGTKNSLPVIALLSITSLIGLTLYYVLKAKGQAKDILAEEPGL